LTLTSDKDITTLQTLTFLWNTVLGYIAIIALLACSLIAVGLYLIDIFLKLHD